MTVERQVFTHPAHAGSSETLAVSAISDELFAHLNTPAALALLKEANRPQSSSAMVQETFRVFAESLGFRSEARGLFAEYPTSSLRPDYFMPVGNSGVLLEVERGKTTTNNMDLLDLWKCHICSVADYLFLIVPRELRHNPTMTPKKEFGAVVNRMSTFFYEGTYTNVRALHVFGY